jgi:hypothetical protein
MQAAPHDRRSPVFRSDARFVVHLIATASQAPQTRTLRRLAPEDAATTYCEASARNKLPVAANRAALTLLA